MSSAEPTPPQQSAPAPDPFAEVEQVRAELQEANERVLRAQAELENYRKRARREMEDDRKYAALPLLKDLLSVVDNLQRAIDAAEQGQGSTALLEGVKMVSAQMTGLFEQYGCQRIPAVGTQFNPHLHEALAQGPSAEHAAGIVTREASAGYQLQDRVIRPAQVFVSTGALT